MPVLKLNFLGSPQVLKADKALKLGVKPLMLLAYLALEGQTKRRTLGSLLWPEAEHPLNNLSVARNTLAKTLGNETLSSDPETLALEVEFGCDVLEWRSRAALADPTGWNLWRGAFLTGMRLTDWEMGLGEELEEWLYSTREKLREERRDYGARLAANLLRLGELEQALPYLEAAQGESGDPHEDATRWYILTLGACGQADHASGVYAKLSATLRQDLGVDPTEATKTALETVRSGGVDACKAALEAEFGRAQRADDSIAPLSPFVGRTHELKYLQAALNGSGARAVVIQGEPGAGKSRLAFELVGSMRSKVRFAQGVCTPGGLPLAPLDAPARALLRDSSLHSGRILEGMPPDWKAALARFLPDVLQSSELSVNPDLERKNLFSALRSLLEDPLKPALLLLDDLQWMDSSTLEFVQFLIATPPESGLKLVLTQRNTEEARSKVSPLLERIHRLELGVVVALEGLTEEPIAQLLTQLGMDGDLERFNPAKLHHTSGGNPFYLLEILRSSGEDGERHVQDLVRSRLKTLPDSARQTLEALAILGDGAGLSLVRKVSGRSLDEAADALEGLENAALVRSLEEGLSFGHDLVREVVVTDTRAVRRSLLNLRAARARKDFPLRAAQHYWHSMDAWDDDDTPEAKRTYVASSANLALRGELNDSLLWSERAETLASSESERLGMRLERSATLERYGRYPEANALLAEVESVLDQDQHPRLRAQALTLRARAIQVERGEHLEARRLVDQALVLLEGDTHRSGISLRGDALAVAGYAAYKMGKLDEALELNEKGLETRKQLEDRSKIAGALSNLAMVLAARGDTKAEDHYLESLHLREELGDVAGVARVTQNLGTFYYRKNELEQARHYFTKSLSTSEIIEDDEGISQASSNLGTILFHDKDFDSALLMYNKALEKIKDSHGKRLLMYNILETHISLNDIINTRTTLEEIMREVQDRVEYCIICQEALDIAIDREKQHLAQSQLNEGPSEVLVLEEMFKDFFEKIGQLEQSMAQDIHKLKIKVDEEEKASQVAEIIQSESFSELRKQAQALRERRAHAT